MRSDPLVLAAHRRRLPISDRWQWRKATFSYSLLTRLNTDSMDEKCTRTEGFYEAGRPLSIYHSCKRFIPPIFHSCQ